MGGRGGRPANVEASLTTGATAPGQLPAPCGPIQLSVLQLVTVHSEADVTTKKLPHAPQSHTSVPGATAQLTPEKQLRSPVDGVVGQDAGSLTVVRGTPVSAPLRAGTGAGSVSCKTCMCVR
jgi:hypothetical protein